MAFLCKQSTTSVPNPHCALYILIYAWFFNCSYFSTLQRHQHRHQNPCNRHPHASFAVAAPAIHCNDCLWFQITSAPHYLAHTHSKHTANTLWEVRPTGRPRQPQRRNQHGNSWFKCTIRKPYFIRMPRDYHKSCNEFIQISVHCLSR